MSDDLTPERAREKWAVRDGRYAHLFTADFDAILAAWERDRADRDALRERLAEVTQQRDALVDAAQSRIDNATGGISGWLEVADAALAAIRAEREAARE
jgi:hypothetical protein